MIVITALEKWNGRLQMTDYMFINEQEKKQFVKMCEEAHILTFERRANANLKAV